MRLSLLFSFTVVRIFLIQPCLGQNRIITGKVIDNCGTPVYPATIFVRNKSYRAGTFTGADGSYTLTVSTKCDSIFCSHLEYETKAESIESNNIINFIVDKKSPKQYSVDVIGTHKYTDIQEFNIEEQDYEKKFIRIEVAAYFPGGTNSFGKYLKENIIYPDSATISDVKGVVKIGFTIDKDGLSKNITLIKGVNKFADNAVLNAIAKMPKWIPAIQNGRNVEEYKEVLVSFNITGVN